MQALGFFLDPSSLEAATTMSSLSQPRLTHLSAADALYSSSIRDAAGSAALYAHSRSPFAAALQGPTSVRLLGLVRDDKLSLAADRQEAAASELSIMYSAELQAAELANWGPGHHAAGSGRLTLRSSGQQARTWKLHSSSLLGCMAQVMGALQQINTSSSTRKVGATRVCWAC